MKNFTNTPNSILLYQAGKVGSTAIAAALRQKGFWVLHVHSLDVSNLRLLIKQAMATREIPPPSIVHGFAFGRISARALRKPRVLTIIRDPIARDLSEFFQNLSSNGIGRQLIARGDYKGMQQEYISGNKLEWTLDWFDIEMKRFLDIDVYESPFDPLRGAARYADNGIDLLLIKTELDARRKAVELQNWLNIDSLSITMENQTKSKKDGDVYRGFLDAAQLPEHLVQSVVDSKFTQHFFSTNERKKLLYRWSARNQVHTYT